MTETIQLRPGLYREGPDGPTLLGSRCRNCQHVHFPAGETCISCRGKDLEVVDLGGEATLFCQTTVHMKTPHFAAGYQVGYVTLPGGKHVFSQLRAVEGKPFKVGMPMKLEFASLWQEDGKDVQCYRFHPR